MQGCCASGWSSHDGFCYKFFTSWAFWWEARWYCKLAAENIDNAKDRDLASIPDHATNKFVSSLACNSTSSCARAWVGGHDSAQEGTWQWSDGSDMDTFTSWYPGEPNNGEGSGQDYMTINYLRRGLWDDDQGWDRFGYICQYKPE